MSAGKILASLIVGCAILAGGALYYLQVYAFYEDASDGVTRVTLHPKDGALAHVFELSEVQAIDSQSSPIRFRACFNIGQMAQDLAPVYKPYMPAEPLNAPSWFDCFDSWKIGTDLEQGKALAFLETENYYYGIDRIVAVYPDASAFMWHQINACGEVVFDGKPAPDHCPTPPER